MTISKYYQKNIEDIIKSDIDIDKKIELPSIHILFYTINYWYHKNSIWF